MTVVRAHVWVNGRVQGVWYRHSCAEEARGLGVNGWVRNLADGRVEAVFEGDALAVGKVLEWCRQGPPRAVVANVDVVDEEPEGVSGFSSR